MQIVDIKQLPVVLFISNELEVRGRQSQATVDMCQCVLEVIRNQSYYTNNKS